MDDLWAIVLGCSTGSGAAIARALAREPGLHVFGVHRGHHPEAAAAVAGDVGAAGRRCVLYQGDAGDVGELAAAVEAFRGVAGARAAAVLVHATAGASLGRFLDTRGDAFHPRQFEKTFRVMAHAFPWWAQALHAGDLLAPNARLLALTNPLHESLLGNCGLIAAAKAALEMYVRHLALELGPLGHRVNLLKFGTVRTPALERVMSPDAMRRLEDAHREMIPAGRMCTVEEVGAFVSVLAGPQVDWFNGATIDFTGGMTLRLLDLVLRPED